MNKKIVFIFIVSFLLLNIIFLKDFFYNSYSNYLFSNKDFSWALNNFSKAKNVYWAYNSANSLYKQNQFEKAIKSYLSIVWDEKNSFNFNIYHNLWNSYYKLWEPKSDEEKLKNFEKSVSFYEKALNIKYDEQTKKNLDFVLDKMKKIQEKKKQEQQEKQNNEQSKSWSWSENSENKSWSLSEDKSSSWSENSKTENWKNSSKSWQNEKWESSLTEEQLQQIENYSKDLKEQEKNSSALFNKVYKWGQNEQNTSDFEALFWNDPFFDNSLLEWWKEEKDW